MGENMNRYMDKSLYQLQEGEYISDDQEDELVSAPFNTNQEEDEEPRPTLTDGIMFSQDGMSSDTKSVSKEKKVADLRFTTADPPNLDIPKSETTQGL